MVDDKRLEEIRSRTEAFTPKFRNRDIVFLLAEVDRLRVDLSIQGDHCVEYSKNVDRLRAELRAAREKALEEAARVCGEEALEHSGRNAKDQHQRAMALGLVAEIRGLKREGK